MTGYLLRRLLILLATLFAASLVVFVVLQILPGDPAAIMLGTGARPDTLAALRHQLGLDAPLLLRYLRWIGGLLRRAISAPATPTACRCASWWPSASWSACRWR